MKAPSQRSPSESTIQDKFWLWGHDAGAHNDSWGLPKPSRITPTEAAFYLGIPNLIMVRYAGHPAPPFNQYALPMRSLRRVVWSIVGAHGETDEQERAHVLELATQHSNITGVMMDDFFLSEKTAHGGRLAALSVEQLRELRSRLAVGERRLDLWAVLYEHQLDQRLVGYLRLLDKVSFWTWDPDKVKDLNANFERLEKLAPDCGKILGCYLWDYGERKPMPLGVMQQQCETGLEWLKADRIEGMIFLASCICDLELDAVEWTRNWIAKVAKDLVESPDFTPDPA
jgi:hypothetical protein